GGGEGMGPGGPEVRGGGAHHRGRGGGPGGGAPDRKDEPVLHAAYLPASPTGVQRRSRSATAARRLTAVAGQEEKQDARSVPQVVGPPATTSAGTEDAARFAARGREGEGPDEESLA